MKFPVLWLSFVSLWVWVGTEKGICLAWDLVSRSRITLHFGAKAVKTKTKTNGEKENRGPDGDVSIEGNSVSDGKSEWSEMVQACVEEG